MAMLQDTNVLILGLGTSGLAMARWCTRQGASVTVADTRTQPPQLGALSALLPQAQFVSGALTAALLDQVPALSLIHISEPTRPY